MMPACRDLRPRDAVTPGPGKRLRPTPWRPALDESTRAARGHRIRSCWLRRAGPALSCGLLLAFAMQAMPARALQSDRDAPTQVEADRMEYDDQQQVNVFTGNVVLTKGTIRLRARRLLVRQDAQGFHFASATGAPARFRQKRDEPGDQWVEGEALRIDYDGKAETVRLREAAQLRRTSDGRSVEEIHGTDIRYESRTGFFTVQGGTAGSAAGTPENPTGRVRVIIQPRETSDPSAAQPATGLSPDATSLAPDDQIRIPADSGPNQ